MPQLALGLREAQRCGHIDPIKIILPHEEQSRGFWDEAENEKFAICMPEKLSKNAASQGPDRKINKSC